MLLEMHKMNDLLRSNRLEIDQLKTETRQLREVATQLEVENRPRLIRLKAYSTDWAEGNYVHSLKKYCCQHVSSKR